MRYLNLLPGLIMLGFTGVQYNDPDGALWAFYYLVPAALAFLAALRLEWLRSPTVTKIMWACVAIWLVLMVLYWPQMPGFWKSEVFMVEETAREGMGMMIAWLVALIATLTAQVKPAADSRRLA